GRRLAPPRSLARHAGRTVAAGVLDQAPGFAAQMRAMDVFVARLHQPGAAELEQRGFGIVVDAMRDDAHADLAGYRKQPPVEPDAERKRQQLVVGGEISLPQPDDVLWVLRAV